MIVVGVWVPVPFPPFVIEGPSGPIDLGPQHAESFADAATAASVKVTALGPIAANNIPPDADAGGPYSGNEGTPTQFDGTATTSVCRTPDGADVDRYLGTSDAESFKLQKK